LQQSRGFGTEFRFADSGTSVAAAAGASDPFTYAAGADDDDLYN
jgi:transitional endoplasmic reticulum ATPase